MKRSTPAASVLLRRLSFALLALAWLPACGANEPAPASEAALVRLVAPPAGALSTASLPRLRIGSESRYVIAERPRFVLRDESVLLPAAGPLSIPIPLPPSTPSGPLRFDAWVSVRDPAAPHATLIELREGARLTLRAAPVVLAPGAAAPGATLTLPVPETARGRAGRLTLIARELAPANLESVELAPLVVPANARLRFGFAVDPAGWEPGSPPVRFEVSAREGGGAALPLFERRLDPAADARDRRWFDAEIELAPLAGRSVAFVFSGEALGDAASRSFPVFSAPELRRAGAPPSTRRNLVLISLDTLRARSVGAYGAPRATTPSLDRRLAARGALVRDAITPFPFTPPAHMSMLTGLSPCAHGVSQPGRDVLAAEHPTLAEALRAAGYHTAAFTEDAYVVAAAGFDRGFDRYVENRSEETASPGFARETFDAATRWLVAETGRPFFLFVHTYQVHEPYAAPRGYDGFFTDADAGDENQRALVRYEREVRYTDDVLADFLDALDARGLADSTIVVVTSDHGEAFGEHFWTAHGSDLHDEALRVPLVVRAPGLVPAGRIVEAQVSLSDVSPTLLELLGIPSPVAADREGGGRSFAGLLTGASGFEERAILASTVTAPGQPAPLSRALRTRSTKYIVTGKDEFFYDLAADPLEQNDLVASSPAGLADARAAFAAELAACDRAGGARSAAARVPSGPDDQPGWFVNRQELDEAVIEKLRSLGYTH